MAYQSAFEAFQGIAQLRKMADIDRLTMSAIAEMPVHATEEMNELSLRLFDGWTEEQMRLFYSERLSESDEFETANCLSILCAAYAVFEHSLNKVAGSALQRCGTKLVLRDFAGSGIERSKLALTKGANVPWDNLSDAWEKISQYRVLRNYFMHAAGLADSGSKDFRELQSFSEVALKEFGASKNLKQIVIRDHYVRTAIETMQDFLEQMHHELEGAAKC